MESAWFPRLMDEELSPLLTASFEKIPSAFIATVGHDILRDDGFLYAKRMRQSRQGQVVKHKHYPTKYHTWVTIDPIPIILEIKAFLLDHPL